MPEGRWNRHVAMLLLSLCIATSVPAARAANVVGGDVLYRERILPPPGAVLSVTLQDVSRADAAAREIGASRMAVKGGPPYAWRITYDPAVIEPGHRYAVRARMTVGETLVMSTTQAYPVLAQKTNRKLTLLLKTVPAASAAAAALAGGAVNPAAQATIPPVPDASLQNTYWKLEQLGDQPAAVQDNRPEPHLVFKAEGRLAGSNGCNRLLGSYMLEGQRLNFGSVASTRMACPGLESTDAAFDAMLQKVSAWKIQGNTLELLSEAGALARFVAVAMR